MNMTTSTGISKCPSSTRTHALGKGSISPFSTVADVEIGAGTCIGPNVTILNGARIGAHRNIFPGAVTPGFPRPQVRRREDHGSHW